MTDLPTITALPPAPSRSDPPATYITKADATMAALPGLVTEINAFGAAVIVLGLATNYSGTSTTSLTIGAGAQALVIQSDKAWQVGQFINIASTANPANYMTGQVTAYNSTTGALAVNVTGTGGTGTFAAWTVSMAMGAGGYATLTGTETLSGKTLTNPIIAGGASGTTAGKVGYSGGLLTYGDGAVQQTVARVADLASYFPKAGGLVSGGLQTTGAIQPGNDANFQIGMFGGTPNIYFDLNTSLSYDRSLHAYRSWIGGGLVASQSVDGLTVLGYGDFTTPNFSSTGGLRLRGNAVSGYAYLQIIDSDSIAEWGNWRYNSAGEARWSGAGGLTLGSANMPQPSGDAPLFAARAWVSFNGTGTVAILGSGNVSGITDRGVGLYTVNFTTAMPNANYSWAANGTDGNTVGDVNVGRPLGGTKSTTAFDINVVNPSAGAMDSAEVSLQFFV